MGWTTDLYCMVSFSKETYTSRSQVEYDLDEARQLVRLMEDKLRALAVMTEPLKMFPEIAERGDNALDAVTLIVNETLESYREYLWAQSKLELLLGNWDKCHTADGRPILPPDNVDWGSAFIDGDFIRGGEEEAD